MVAASPGDAQPVFDLTVRHATKLCAVPTAALFEYDGELVHVRATYNMEGITSLAPLHVYWD